MKKITIKSGVNLIVMPTKQFKTLNIAVDFAAPLSVKGISNRALISYLTAVSSEKYPTQQAVAQKTIELFGAQYQTDVLRFGQTHHVRYSFQMPSPVYIKQKQDESILSDAFTFLREMIFNPLVKSDSFDAATFAQEQQSLMHEVKSLADDNKRYAMMKLHEIMFDSIEMQLSTLGSVQDIAALNAKSVYQCYQDMIKNDNINIVVFGDVNVEEIVTLVEQWHINARTENMLMPFYRQKLQDRVQSEIEYHHDMSQAVLTLAYQVAAVKPHDSKRFVAIVLNALFGGLPLSKLFVNIREKHSLAYSIYSRWEYDTGFLTVFAGLDADKIEKTTELIQAELHAIQAGDITVELLESTKNSIINDYISQQDVPMQQMALSFSRVLMNHETTYDEWIAGINQVSIEDIAALANEMVLQTKFVLLPGMSK